MELGMLLSLARHGLQFLGGLLVMHGFMEETAIEFLVGAGANLLALGWYWKVYNKTKKESSDGTTSSH